jgi:hypothetical protein
MLHAQGIKAFDRLAKGMPAVKHSVELTVPRLKDVRLAKFTIWCAAR